MNAKLVNFGKKLASFGKKLDMISNKYLDTVNRLFGVDFDRLIPE